MAEHKVLIMGVDDDDPLDYERAEMADLDVEFVKANPDSEGEAIELVRDADALMMRSTPYQGEQVIRAAEKAQVLAVYSHGFNQIDTDVCNEMGIIITNGAGMCMEEVSNQAVTMILCLNRQLIQFNERTKAGKWGRGDDIPPIEPIDQQVLGLVGLGNIGRQVARKMFNGWRMKVIAYDPYCPPWIAQEYAVEQVFSLHELFERSDYISVQIPLNKETHHMMRKEHFDCMKPTAYFVNVCRGGVVREVDLIQALREGKMRGAGLDVFEQEPVDPDNPLLKMDNVIVAPHSAGQSTRSAWLARQRASQQVAAVLRGNWPSAGQNPEVASSLKRRDRMQSLEPKLEASREVLPMAVLPEGR